jgi:hypothetical protein
MTSYENAARHFGILSSLCIPSNLVTGVTNFAKFLWLRKHRIPYTSEIVSDKIVLVLSTLVKSATVSKFSGGLMRQYE